MHRLEKIFRASVSERIPLFSEMPRDEVSPDVLSTHLPDTALLPDHPTLNVGLTREE